MKISNRFKKLLDRWLIYYCANWQAADDKLKTDAYKIFLKWASNDNQELADMLFEVLKDKTLADSEIIKLLTFYVKSQPQNTPLGNVYLQELLSRLEDNKLTSDEIIEVAALWVSSLTNDTNLHELIKAASTNQLSLSKAEAALRDWIKSKDPSLAGKLQKIIDSGRPLTLRSLLLLSVSYFIKHKLIGSVPSAVDKQIAEVIDTFKKIDAPDLLDIIKSLVNEKDRDALNLILRAFEMAKDESLLNAFLQDKAKEVASKHLTKIIKKNIANITDDQTAALVATAIGLFKQEISLVATSDEKTELHMSTSQYKFWQKIRNVIFSARLAVKGGAIVSTESNPKPHVFSGSFVAFDTKLKSLVEENKWELFSEFINKFMRSEFREYKFNQKDKFINVRMIRDGSPSQAIYSRAASLADLRRRRSPK